MKERQIALATSRSASTAPIHDAFEERHSLIKRPSKVLNRNTTVALRHKGIDGVTPRAYLANLGGYVLQCIAHPVKDCV